jgi:hypothetical protein
MKFKAAGIVCVLILIGAWVYIHAQPAASSTLPVGANGRYQIIAVNLSTADGTNDSTSMKIDTQTGRTWTLIEYWDSTANGTRGNHHRGWVEIHPIPGEAN